MLDLRHLRTLRAIAARGSLTGAAHDLHCTQSALSHALADLERRLRLPLAQRAGRPLRLTAAGRRLATLAEAVLPLVAAAEDDLARLRRGGSGRLLLSLECHSCFEWLVPALDAYRAAWPEVDLDLRVGASFDPLPALLGGGVDAIITSERADSPGVRAFPLFRYEIVAVLPPRHRLAGRASVQPGDFARETMITYPVDDRRLDAFSRFLTPAGVAPARRRTAELTALIVQLVASGHGLAALPQWAVAGAVRQGAVATARLGRAGLHADLHALRRDEDADIAHIDAFIDLTRATCFRTLDAIAHVPAGTSAARHRRRSRTSV